MGATCLFHVVRTRRVEHHVVGFVPDLRAQVLADLLDLPPQSRLPLPTLARGLVSEVELLHLRHVEAFAKLITGSQAQPSRDWLSPKLGYLAGSRSRAKVRNWFRGQDRDQHLRQGREILERELTRLGVRDVASEEIATRLKQKDSDTLLVALGAGDMTAASIATALQKMRGTEIPRPVRHKRSQKHKENKANGIAISGIGDLMCNFARCCRPVPPEAITGYITQGRGVTIHRQDCGNVLGLYRRYPERTIEVDWGSSESATYPVDLMLRSFDRTGLLRDITMVLADENANILEVKTLAAKDSMESVLHLSVEIPDLPTLSTVISRLEQLPNVVAVKRKN